MKSPIAAIQSSCPVTPWVPEKLQKAEKLQAPVSKPGGSYELYRPDRPDLFLHVVRSCVHLPFLPNSAVQNGLRCLKRVHESGTRGEAGQRDMKHHEADHTLYSIICKANLQHLQRILLLLLLVTNLGSITM